MNREGSVMDGTEAEKHKQLLENLFTEFLVSKLLLQHHHGRHIVDLQIYTNRQNTQT